MSIKVDHVVDAKGLACPMPVVKTKKMMDQIEAGQVLLVEATDRGSLADMKGWAKNTGNQYLGSKEDGDVLFHYLRKSDDADTTEVAEFEPVAQNDDVKNKIGEDSVTILDVREPAEYVFSRVPGAVSIPMGDLEDRLGELNKDDEIYVICRTGSRSNMASHTLKEQGFEKVYNVKPGMTEWDGPTEGEA
ncbi:sulfurtransferase TusA family protein [Salisediminibacterium selenitireducens]|uniref:SirA family protein n=1 Tax=Bacillus selenitireducens (strain ATCC 700615 / DSM 15326 / MLS10) TaxID=439292 RepID=D6XYK9_BACIE|nr:sulfurtransferase TusA family protein [Salisediminibacterium selenitireducens]ADI00278.1 SirA family protein [[Bacillus] selenitireducens MLS10]